MIDTPLVRQTLVQATESVLERMFFQAVLEHDAEPADTISDGLHTTVQFEGDATGQFDIVLSPDAASTMANDFLPGQHEPVEETMCEFTNMTCGAFLSQLQASQHFRLLSPYVVAEPAPAPPPAALMVSESFALECGNLIVSVRFTSA